MADQQLPEIRRAPIGKLTIYEISESELETIERGSPDSVYLTFSIFLFSVAISFSVALATTTIPSNRTFDVFVIVTIIGYLGAAILFIVWLCLHKSIRTIAREIRSRLPPEGEQLQQGPTA